MTKLAYFLPMHSVTVFLYPGFELMDASGPASVLAGANHALRERGKPPYYAVRMASPEGGLIASSSGVALETSAVSGIRPGKVDSLLIAGGEAESLKAVIARPLVRRWVPRCAKAATRFGSVCSGTFVLAALGLLSGKRVATHWSGCEQLAKMYPSVIVDSDTLYAVDGKVWTSAGVTTGIDMTLAMVTQDLGSDIASAIARRLVLYARRPGYQSQFSPLLQAQVSADSPFAELISWLQVNLARSLNVPSLAARTGLSERTFYRKFLASTGESPARFVETIRLDAARMLLTQGLSLKVIAARVGLSPASRLTEAFERRFGVTPTLFRAMHGSL